MFKIILWDIDGTVLNFSLAERNAIKSAFETLNIGKCTDEMAERYSQINQSYWARLEKGEFNKNEILVKRFVEFIKEYNLNVDAKILGETYESKIVDTIAFIDNSFEILNKLKHNHEQYAITNGTLKTQQARLNKSRLINVFDDVFISDEIGYEKPSKYFFDYVFNKISPCNKNEILVVGDSLSSDIKGANNAGVKCCWYNPSNKTNNLKLTIDYEIHNLNELLDIV
jgi:2-haloacid dehalogenase